jgi:hypothetical protein
MSWWHHCWRECQRSSRLSGDADKRGQGTYNVTCAETAVRSELVAKATPVKNFILEKVRLFNLRSSMLRRNCLGAKSKCELAERDDRPYMSTRPCTWDKWWRVDGGSNRYGGGEESGDVLRKRQCVAPSCGYGDGT